MEQTRMEQSRLKIETHENKTLADAMAMKSDAPFLLAYSPTRCAFANWDSEGNKVVALDGKEMADVYEVRAFGENFELRWVKGASCDTGKDAPDERGSVATLCEQPEGDEYSCLPGEYLLWGTAASRQTGAGHVVLSEEQVGALTVPSPTAGTQSPAPAKGSRVALLFKEYFKPDDKYGNLVFITERLCGLKTLEPKSPSAQSG
jgi:CRISPR-associated protein (TIGR03984 family)